MFKKIYLEITNICNLNCPFCDRTNKDKKYMSITGFEHVLKEIKPYTEYLYLHIQGEPLFHPNFSEIIALCDKYSFHVNITTNTTLLEKQIEVITKSTAIRQINLSLQAIYHSTNKEKYFQNILDLINTNPDKYISLRLWGNFDNEITMEITKYFQEHISNTEITTNKLKDHVFFSFEKEFTWPSIKHDFNTKNGRCRGTIDHLGILSNGDVVPCCLDKDGVIAFGNIFTESFTDILKSERFLNMKVNIQKGILIEELCTKCTYHNRFK